MMMIILKKTIKIFLFVEVAIGATYLYSSVAFANIQVAFLSAFFVIIGSAFAYKRMLSSQLASKNYEEQRDLLDSIEDPHELYEEVNETPTEELDLKEIVKEEKAKIKTFSLKSIKHGAKGSISAFRLVPYIFLILGFIALKNNELLNLAYYLPALLVGIVTASLVSPVLTSK